MSWREPSKDMVRVAADMRMRAAASSTYNGLPTMENHALIQRCRRVVAHNPELLASLIFTRDEGMHACGWWKNPDYERCYHLSLSFRGPRGERVQQQHDRARAWGLAFFRDDVRKIWIEPPFSAPGKQFDVYHYRLFMAPDWRTATMPRREVYTKEFTELQWKTWSEQHGVPDLLGQKPP